MGKKKTKRKEKTKFLLRQKLNKKESPRKSSLKTSVLNSVWRHNSVTTGIRTYPEVKINQLKFCIDLLYILILVKSIMSGQNVRIIYI